MKYKIIVSSVLALFLGVSCEDFFQSEVTPPDSYSETKLIVHGYLTPTEAPTVSISESTPIFGEAGSRPPIGNAVVELSDDGGNKVLLLPIGGDRFGTSQANFPIESGKTYYISVSAPNDKKASAQCTVPLMTARQIDNVRMIRSRTDGMEALQIAFDFQDNQGERNYYMARGTYHTSWGVSVSIDFQPFTDTNNEGKTIYARSEKYSTSTALEEIKKIDIELYEVDVHLYDYFRTILLQQKSEDLGAFAEPVMLISNINDGFGVFGGYTKQSISVDF
ncbi:MAG: DUF4249 domain-containing protein [Capnocytophaga sp.]|nr:DUF4249 domain-containing protein [Capnocytophaga sp.]